MAAALLTVVATLSIVFGTYWVLVVRHEKRMTGRLRKRLQVADERTIGIESVLKGLPPARRGGPFATLLAWYERYSVTATARLIESAGMRTDPHWLIGGTALALMLVQIVLRIAHAGVGTALVAGAMTPLLPYFYIRYMAKRRLNAFEERFPDAISLMARALRAGHAVTATLAMIADEVDEPVKSEFRALYEQHNYGLPMTDVMRTFATRVSLMDVRFFSIAVLTQRETGGNLAEVLDNLATVMRDRFRVRRQLKALTAQGRLTGWILGALPVVLGVGLYLLNPHQMETFVADPVGMQLLELSVGLEIVGAVAIYKILRMEY